VLVAWICAIAIEPDPTRMTSRKLPFTERSPPTGSGADVIIAHGYGLFRQGVALCEWHEFSGNPIGGNAFEDRRGWPMPALASEYRWNSSGQWGIHSAARTPFDAFAMKPLTFPTLERLLPLRPVWPGFVVDALLVSAMAGIPLVIAPWIRRRRRARTNRCLACGYRLGDSETCPECGTHDHRPRRTVPDQVRA
jgi:hypothetical protein